jgi:hypothetical protein
MRGLFAQTSSVAFFAWSCLGCSGDGTPGGEPPECDSKCEAEKDDSGADSNECLDVPSFGEVAGFTKCRTCHDSSLTGADRNGAPAAYNFDDYDVASGLADRIAMLVAREEMPPASSGVTVTDTQRAEIVTWALCGAPP